MIWVRGRSWGSIFVWSGIPSFLENLVIFKYLKKSGIFRIGKGKIWAQLKIVCYAVLEKQDLPIDWFVCHVKNVRLRVSIFFEIKIWWGNGTGAWEVPQLQKYAYSYSIILYPQPIICEMPTIEGGFLIRASLLVSINHVFFVFLFFLYFFRRLKCVTRIRGYGWWTRFSTESKWEIVTITTLRDCINLAISISSFSYLERLYWFHDLERLYRPWEIVSISTSRDCIDLEILYQSRDLDLERLYRFCDFDLERFYWFHDLDPRKIVSSLSDCIDLDLERLYRSRDFVSISWSQPWEIVSISRFCINLVISTSRDCIDFVILTLRDFIDFMILILERLYRP